MARICARCRQPVGRRADDHACLDDDEDGNDIYPEPGPAYTLTEGE